MNRLLLFSVLCAGMLHAQTTLSSTFKLDNGATVLYQTFSQVDLNDPARNFGTVRASGNMIERNMRDGANRTLLGFQLGIERLPGDPIRFRLTMGPQGGWGFFGKSAPPREIQNGDRVLLDVLEEPGTGRKIFDTFQVGIGIGMQFLPASKSVPQIPGEAAVIHLQAPDFLAGKTSLGKNSSGLAVPTVNVLVPGKGLFSFSAKAKPGYRMEAIAEGNVLMFVEGGDRYDIQCSSAIMDGPGAWYLWVRHDPAVTQSTFWTLELTAR